MMKLRTLVFLSLWKKNLKNKKELLLTALVIVLGSFFVFQKTMASGEFLITEIMYNPSDGGVEWVEIFNNTDSEINLEGWKLKETSGGSELEQELDAGEYLVICDNERSFLEKYPDFNGKLIQKNLTLNNGGEEIEILNQEGKVVDFVKYEDDRGGDGNGSSVELDNGDWRESYVLGGTPGEDNSKKAEEEKTEYKKEIRINELFPNPTGDESVTEFIELYNFSQEKISLDGWVLKDSSKTGKGFVFGDSFEINAEDFLVVYRSDFDFALNNSGEEKVYLLDPNGEVISEISYEKAAENLSYGFDDEQGKWRWSKFVTPEKKNKFDRIPEMEIKKDDDVYEDIESNFEIDLSSKNEDTKITWDFGDGSSRSYQEKTKHKYKKNGKYVIAVMVFTGSEEIVKKIDVTVKKFPEIKMEIVGIAPNPAGKDAGAEWIELQNKSTKDVDLANWSIASGSGDGKIANHPILKKFVIESGKSRRITKSFCNFSLANGKGEIELRYPDGRVADKLKYGKEGGIKDNEIFGKNKNGQWTWTGGKVLKIKKNGKIKFNGQEEVLGENSGEMIEEEIENETDDTKNETNNEKEALQEDAETNDQVGSKIFLTVTDENGESKTFVRAFSPSKTVETPHKKQKHYLRVFLEEINIKLNAFIGNKSQKA